MRWSTWRRMACLAPAVVVVASCSNLSDEERDAIDANQRQIDEIQGGSNTGFDFSPSEEQCAEDLAEERDFDLRSAVADADAVDERVLLVEIVLACADDIVASDEFVQSFANTMTAGAGNLVEIDLEEARCMLGDIIAESPEPARALVAPNDDDIQVALAAFEKCLPADEFAAITGAAGAGPQEYGDDERFDRLHDDCTAGSALACDHLYGIASAGSAYEDLGAECAGRNVSSSGQCSEDLVLDETGFLDPSAPGTAALQAACTAGEYVACDVIYLYAPLGSDVENFGFTCDGRIPIGALPDCATRFADEG